MNSDNVIREGQILIGRVLGAHNGRLATADFLVKRLRRPPAAEVDSNALFRVVDRA